MIELAEARTALADLTSRIRELLREADWQEAAAELWLELSDEQRLAIARAYLVEHIRQVAGRDRRAAFHPIASAKWDEVRELAESGELAERLFGAWVDVAGRRVRFGECTAEDLLTLAEQHEAKALENEHYAKLYRRVLGTLERHGAARVADLPIDVVEEALRG